MKISIVIPTYNHCEDQLKPCLESLIKYTDLTDIEVIVSCNGCVDGTREYVESLGGHFKIVWSDDPTGFTIGTNDGIKVATGEYIIMLSNDTILLDQKKNAWINMLIDPLIKDPKIGITGPMQVEWDNTGRNFLIFFCVAMRKKLFDEIGLLDEIFNPGFAEDVDMCMKAQDAGYRLMQVPFETRSHYEPNRMIGGFPIFHKGEETLKHLSGVNDILDRNTAIARKRYPQLPQGFFNKEDIETYRNLLNRVPENGVIAELGCFKGRSLASIAGIIKYKNIKVVAVDTFAGSKSEGINGAGFEVFKNQNIKEEFLNNMEVFGLAPQVMDMSTHEASSYFEDNYFDLVFIDAEHTCEEVTQDIKDWLPKVKRGGLLVGHDFNFHGVKEALNGVLGGANIGVKDNIWVTNKFRVYDCFPFCNELDQLEIRLNELNDVVDYFVLVEGTETHQGNPKPLYFWENRKRFEKFLPKIRHIIVDNWPNYVSGEYSSSWTRERFQRDSIMRGLDDVKNQDILILGDADEIVSAKAVKEYNPSMGLAKLEMNFYFYYINYMASDCLVPEKKWMESRIVPVSYFKKYDMTPCSVRYSPGSLQFHHIDNLPSIPNAGWHFSFQGGIDAIINKIKSYAHQEFNRPDILDRDRIEKLVDEGKDVFGREGTTYSIVPIDETYPICIKNNLTKFNHMIKW